MVAPPDMYLLNHSLKQAKIEGTVPWHDLEMDLFDVKVYRDLHPVTPGHLVFVPERAAVGNMVECVRLAMIMGDSMVRRGECDGYNIGINQGQAAGQTVMYPHVHLIPRSRNDVADATGGIRNVIPGQGNWQDAAYRAPMPRT